MRAHVQEPASGAHITRRVIAKRRDDKRLGERDVKKPVGFSREKWDGANHDSVAREVLWKVLKRASVEICELLNFFLIYSPFHFRLAQCPFPHHGVKHAWFVERCGCVVHKYVRDGLSKRPTQVLFCVMDSFLG